MDPFSIAATSLGLAVSIVKLSEILYKGYDEVRSVSSNLQIFHHELITLSDTLKSLSHSLKRPEFKVAFPTTTPDNAQHLSQLKLILSGCETTVGQFELLLNKVRNSGFFAHGMLRRPVQALQLGRRGSDMDRIRKQLQTFQSALQLSVNMINVLIAAKSNVILEVLDSRVENGFSDLKAEILGLRFSIQAYLTKTNDGDFPELQNENIMSMHILNYVASAEEIIVAGSVVSSAAEHKREYANPKTTDGSGSLQSEKEYIEALETLRAMGYTISCRKSINEALGWAVHTNKISVVKALHRCGADFDTYYDCRDAKGDLAPLCDAFTCAVRHGYLELLTFLLQNRLHLWLPLPCAILKGNDAVIKLVLEGDVDINAEEGETALYCAVLKGNEAVVQILLESGAHVDTTSANNWTPLHRAALGGHKAIIQMLLKSGADINAKDGTGCTPLHHAASEGHEAAVQVLLGNGADINTKGWINRTPLYCAASGGHEAVVQVLLENGAHIYAWDQKDWTALHSAANAGHESVVEVLLKYGADMNGDSINGAPKAYWTPLHRAVHRGREAVVQVLLKSGASVNAEDKACGTPLYVAVRYGHEAIVQILLKHGALQSSSIQEIAASKGNKKILQILKDAKGDL